MKLFEGSLTYSAPEISVLLLEPESVICQSDLTYGNDGEPGGNPGWGDEFNF